MIDSLVRSVLTVGIAATGIYAVVVYRHTWRSSRRGSIVAMAPTLTIWFAFEVSLLADWSFDLSIWLSRLGVVSIVATLLFQLWSIDYTERVERRLRDE
jgi:hypothetical protein